MSLHNIYKALFYLSIGSSLIPITFCIVKFKTLNSLLRVLFIYLLICALTECFSILPLNCLGCFYAVQNTFTLLEVSLLTVIYYLAFQTKGAKTVVLLLGVVLILLALFIYLIQKRYDGPDSIVSALESVIMIAFAIAFYRKIFNDLRNLVFMDYYLVILNAAVLIYFSSSLILFLFDDFLTSTSKLTFERLWSLHLVSNITYNSLLSIAVWKHQRSSSL